MYIIMEKIHKESALSPFKHQAFAIMWIAALISNIGTWMHSVGAGWLMTNLSPSPLIISLVQTSTTLPIFLFALLAGALADIFNRRILLLIINCLMLIVASTFAILVYSGNITAELLLIFTFLFGAGAAFIAPAWQAIIPQIVSKEELPQAVTLGGISMNISRAIGPALAGLCISFYGLSSPFIANAISFIAIIMALLWWKYTVPAQSGKTLPPERVVSAIKAGVRYAIHSNPLKSTMWHIAGFMFFANAYWGLLPIISKHQLHGNATFFGSLMGAVGFGAIIGALFMPKLQSKFSANQMVTIGTIGTSLVTLYFAVVENQILAVITSLCFGMSWLLVLASVNVSAQQALPDWVRARGLSAFLMVFFGSMSLGAAFWGWLAVLLSIKTSLFVASIGGITFIAFSYKAELQQGKNLDFTPSLHLKDPVTHSFIHNDEGPVIIQIYYNIAMVNREAFLKAIYKLKHSRMRDGAYQWGVYEDTERQGYFIEFFMEESWGAHLRHHTRITNTDKQLQDIVIAFHNDTEPPQVRHFLAINDKYKTK